MVNTSVTKTYKVTVSNGNRESSDTATINVLQPNSASITANAGRDKTNRKGESITLTTSRGHKLSVEQW